MKSFIITAAIIALVGGASVSKAEFETKASGLCYEINQVVCSQDCRQLFLCVQDEGRWEQILIETCSGGNYCNGGQGRCTSNLSTCSPTSPPVYQLNCSATGHFPDPYDCTVYHECQIIGSPSEVSACQVGWSYNALTTACDHRLSSSSCYLNSTLPACTRPGQSDPVPENDNIYYVCLQKPTGLMHELFKCAHGGHYSGGKCKENNYKL